MRNKKTSKHAVRFILPIVGMICLLLGGCSKDEPESPEPSMFPAYKYRGRVTMKGIYEIINPYSFPGLFVYGNDIPIPASMWFSREYKFQIPKEYSFVEEAGLEIVGKEKISYNLPDIGENMWLENLIQIERKDSHTLIVTTLSKLNKTVDEQGIEYIRIGMKDAVPVMINSKEGDFIIHSADEFDGDTNIGFRIYPGSITENGHNFIYQPSLIYDNR